MFDCQFVLKLGKNIISPSLCYDDTVVGIFGASGSGKTSILHAIAGIIRPQTGCICIGGHRWFDSYQKINLPTQRRRVGLVFQDAHLFSHKNVRQNLYFGYERLRATERRFTPDEIIELLRLSHLLERMPTRLSGGEKQRVALGRALLYSPNLLLMDEPLSALDSELKQEILPFFKYIRDVVTIPMLYVSHDLGEIRSLTQTIYHLKTMPAQRK